MSSEPSDEWAREGFQGQSCQTVCMEHKFWRICKATFSLKKSRTTVARSSTKQTHIYLQTNCFHVVQSQESDELL